MVEKLRFCAEMKGKETETFMGMHPGLSAVGVLRVPGYASPVLCDVSRELTKPGPH